MLGRGKAFTVSSFHLVRESQIKVTMKSSLLPGALLKTNYQRSRIKIWFDSLPFSLLPDLPVLTPIIPSAPGDF